MIVGIDFGHPDGDCTVWNFDHLPNHQAYIIDNGRVTSIRECHQRRDGSCRLYGLNSWDAPVKPDFYATAQECREAIVRLRESERP